MVTRSLELEAPGATVWLRTDETGWCRVELSVGEHVEALGADTEKVVTERLANGLRDELTGSTVGDVDGASVRWVLSLSEKHYTIYAADVAGSRRLSFQGPDGNIRGTVTLGPEQRRHWLSLLLRS